MTPPRPIGVQPIGVQPIGVQPIGAMSSSRVILGELLSSRARLRFPGHAQPATATPVRTRKSQRTAHRDFSHCLTPGGHSIGVLKQQRGMRQFRTRGLNQVGNEFTLATLAFNITRLHAMRAA